MVQGNKIIRQVVHLRERGLFPFMCDGENCRWCCGNYQGVGGADMDLTTTAWRKLKSLWHGLETCHSAGKTALEQGLQQSNSGAAQHKMMPLGRNDLFFLGCVGLAGTILSFVLDSTFFWFIMGVGCWRWDWVRPWTSLTFCMKPHTSFGLQQFQF